ncbi:MAG: D-alanine--D-alanine ligase family protein [Thermincolia bacterium]
MTDKLRVAVIYGGRSGEHEVSLQSAASVMEAMDRKKYEVIPVKITKKGQWLFQGSYTGETLPTTSQLKLFDVAFPVLHGTNGEDGTIQGLLELANIPYVGGGVTASAVGMDKSMMKSVFAFHGLPQAKFLTVLRSHWENNPAEVRQWVSAQLGYPCFVKPANLGSSVGISKANAPEELGAALDLAARFDRKIIIEEFIAAREIEVAVLGNDSPTASVPGEIRSLKDFYDYEAKYTDGNAELYIPADIPQDAIEQARRLAVAAFKAIDCAGMARVDFFLTKESDELLVNEINTIPGFTKFSMYPKLWEATGLNYSKLIDELIQLAIERHRDKAAISY